MKNNAYLLLALTALFWSGNHIVGRAAAGVVPPFAISTIRWFIPMLLLWPMARPHLIRDWPTIRAHWGILLWLGITGGAMFSALQYVGLNYTSALNMSVLNSLVPVLIVAVGALIFRDRIGLIQFAGIATSSLGVLTIIARGHLETLQQLAFNRGDLVVVVSMIVFAVYSVYLRKCPSIHALSFLFVLAAIATVGTLPFFVWELMSGVTPHATWLTVGALLYVGIFPSVLAFAAWNRGVQLIGASRAGPFLHLVPIYTAVLAALLLGETLAAYHVVGLALILTGVWLASGRKATA